MRLVDTHCHLDLEAFDPDRDEVVERACAAGVSDLLVIAFEPERWRASLQLASQHPNVRVAAGLHPNSASLFGNSTIEEISSLAERTEVIAIGETGIDLYWDAAPLTLQRDVFASQIALAQDLELPFIVHQREAETEVLDVMQSFGKPLNGVLHCFTGDWHYAQSILELGMSIGLGGAVTFKSRTALHDAARRIPLDRIVLETDSPFMAPVPYRGKRNEPAYVRTIAERLAELRGEDVEMIAATTTANAMELFPGLGSAV